MGLGANWYQIGKKICYVPKVRKFSVMLTGLKVSFLACKCVFYRPEHNAKRMNFLTSAENTKKSHL